MESIFLIFIVVVETKSSVDCDQSESSIIKLRMGITMSFFKDSD